VNQYYYDGPVMEFGRCIANGWKAYTYAVSEKKALNNLACQFKKSSNRVMATKITLPGKLRKEERDGRVQTELA